MTVGTVLRKPNTKYPVLLKNGILRVSFEKKKDARAGFRVKTTFFRIIIRGDYYDAEKSGFHAGSRACVLFFLEGYSQNHIFNVFPDFPICKLQF